MYIVILFFICRIVHGYVSENDTIENDNTTIASRRTHQITTILDGLLKDYQAHIRPNFGGNITQFFIRNYLLYIYVEGPTKIDFDILVSSFGPIQDMDMVCI